MAEARKGAKRLRSVWKIRPSIAVTAATAAIKGSSRSQLTPSSSSSGAVKDSKPRDTRSLSWEMVKTATVAAMKHRHATLHVQNVHASSMANITPPMGAPNAAARPAAAPALMNSRWSASSKTTRRVDARHPVRRVTSSSSR